MLAIFLNNKLITLDTILPLMFELKQRWPAMRAEFYCFDLKTEYAIRENVVLSDVLNQIGRLRMLGRRRPGRLHWAGHRVRVMFSLARIFFQLLRSSTYLIHFKALNEYPLRIFYLLAPRRTIYVQSTPITHSELERRVDRLIKPRDYPTVRPAAGRLVGFDTAWDALSDPRLRDLPRHLVPPPFQLRSWHDYLRSIGPTYLATNPNDTPDQPATFAVFVLSSMDRAAILRDPDGFPSLFQETLEILKEAVPELRIVVKPHPATRADYRAMIRNTLSACRSKGQYVVETHLHPLLLAQSARFFIGNLFSSTFANPVSVGVPTIEYSRYADHTLSETRGGSFRPDLVNHFIDGDGAVLRSLVKDLIDMPPKRSSDNALVDSDKELDRLFALLRGEKVS